MHGNRLLKRSYVCAHFLVSTVAEIIYGHHTQLHHRDMILDILPHSVRRVVCNEASCESYYYFQAGFICKP